MIHAFCVFFTKKSQIIKSGGDIFPIFSAKSFIVLAHLFLYVIYFELIFIYGVGWGSRIIFPQTWIVSAILKTFPSPFNYNSNFFKNQLTMYL